MLSQRVDETRPLRVAAFVPRQPLKLIPCADSHKPHTACLPKEHHLIDCTATFQSTRWISRGSRDAVVDRSDTFLPKISFCIRIGYLVDVASATQHPPILSGFPGSIQRGTHSKSSQSPYSEADFVKNRNERSASSKSQPLSKAVAPLATTSDWKQYSYYLQSYQVSPVFPSTSSAVRKAKPRPPRLPAWGKGFDIHVFTRSSAAAPCSAGPSMITSS